MKYTHHWSTVWTVALGSLTLSSVLVGCNGLRLDPRPVPTAREDVRTTSGVEWTDLYRGHGPVSGPQDTLVVDYVMSLPSGERLMSTIDLGTPLRVRLGEAPVPGLDDGLLGMQATGRRRIRVPSALGYGARGVPNLVPPDSDLVFEVHCLDVVRD